VKCCFRKNKPEFNWRTYASWHRH